MRKRKPQIPVQVFEIRALMRIKAETPEDATWQAVQNAHSYTPKWLELDSWNLRWTATETTGRREPHEYPVKIGKPTQRKWKRGSMRYGTAISYHVFVRNWWRMENGNRVPNPEARKTTIARGCTEQEARAICARYAETHNPGRLSRKAEYERE